MTTETRWRLKRDWPSPLRETIPASTLGGWDGQSPVWVFRHNGYFDEVAAPAVYPDWFDAVTWCLDCDREVCPSSVMCCGGESTHDHDSTKYCHGHAEPTPEPRPRHDVWSCKIGFADGNKLPPGADGALRSAVEAAFEALVGKPDHFCFSGWGATLDEDELSVLDEGPIEPKPRPPYPVPDDEECYFIAWGDGTVYARRLSRDRATLGLTRWRTRPHAETAAEAHRLLDEVLQAAFNVAAIVCDVTNPENHTKRSYRLAEASRDFDDAKHALDRAIHAAKRGGK